MSDFMPHAESFGSHTAILEWYEIAVWLAFVAWLINFAVGLITVRNMPLSIRRLIWPAIQLLTLYGVVSIVRTFLDAIVLRWPLYTLQAAVFFIDAHVVIGLATVGIWYYLHPERNIFTFMEHHKRDSDRYRSMIESARITGLIEIDENKTIWFASRTAYHLFGYEGEELEGKQMSVLIPRRFWILQNKGIDDFLRTGESALINSPTPFQLTGLNKTGQEFDLELCLSFYVFNDAYHFVAAVRDVTYRVSLEKALKGSNGD